MVFRCDGILFILEILQIQHWQRINAIRPTMSWRRASISSTLAIRSVMRAMTKPSGYSSIARLLLPPHVGWPEARSNRWPKTKVEELLEYLAYNHEPEAIHARISIASFVPAPAPLWHFSAGLTRRWQDPFCHCAGDGTWQVSPSSQWL